MSESVKVAVRCRPMSQKELQQGCKNVVSIDPLSKTCTLESPSLNGGKVYQFDAAFGSESSTESVYEDVGSVIVEAVLDGYNGTVFAYGQTGCGKSYTMHGFIERTLEHLFEATSTSSTETRYLALLSYLEIYNERLRDLLQDGETPLQLKEDPSRGTYVAGGLREVTVKNALECSKLVNEGDRRRAAAATKMNAASSRSHAVLTLSLEAIAINEDDKRGGAIRRGRLHLVDLAGSERQTRTGATGDRLKEAASINLSLSALGNVISALAAGNGRHVPYRDSKLTRLLRDSLGGNARTLMIACISPSDVDAEETLSTLRYAARARCIKNKPVVNEDPKDALLRQYQVELQRLRKLLESSSDLSSFSIREEDGVKPPEDDDVIERLRKECESSNQSALKLQEELEALRSKFELAEPGFKPSPTCPEDLEREERRRKKREAAKQEVLKRLEKLTIGGEARGDSEARKRREKRRKRLETLASALEASAQEGNGSVFQVYGQLKSTEDALKRMARKAKQLEAEVADLQASWDAERRDLLRRELLATQICDAMVPYLRPGCPFRNVSGVRDAATWCDELGRWRLPDSVARIPLPPPSVPRDQSVNFKSDLNNNNNSSNNNRNGNGNGRNAENGRRTGSAEENSASKEFGSGSSSQDIADAYFRRSRIDALLAHVREAKTFETGRLTRSGGSEESGSCSQLNALNLQSSTPVLRDVSATPSNLHKQIPRTGWVGNEDNPGFRTAAIYPMTTKRNNPPPRVLEALPSFPLSNSKVHSLFEERNVSPDVSQHAFTSC